MMNLQTFFKPLSWSVNDLAQMSNDEKRQMVDEWKKLNLDKTGWSIYKKRKAIRDKPATLLKSLFRFGIWTSPMLVLAILANVVSVASFVCLLMPLGIMQIALSFAFLIQLTYDSVVAVEGEIEQGD